MSDAGFYRDVQLTVEARIGEVLRTDLKADLCTRLIIYVDWVVGSDRPIEKAFAGIAIVGTDLPNV